MRFADFKTAAQAGTPDFLQAELERARIDSANKQQEYAQNKELMADAATMYDKWTGDSTPIADAVSGAKNSMVEALRGSNPAYFDAGMDMPTDIATTAPTDAIAGMGDMPMDAATTTMVDSGADALDAAGMDFPVDTGVPIVSALRGVDQLAQGDIAGAAGTGAKAYLSTLGPWGMGAGALLSLLGL